AHMVFVTAGMGGGTGTGAAPVIARISKELGILTVAVVTKPFQFEGQRRMRFAEQGIQELQKVVDTLLIIPNQNLFRIANEKTTFADAFAMADQVLYSGVGCITDLMVKEGLINLDFADVRAVMREMGKAMMGTGEASGEKRASTAAEAAIANPLIDYASMKGAKGLLISITGGKDLTLYEVDEAATRIREEVDQDANIIVGATFDESLEGIIRVSVVATGIDNSARQAATPDTRIKELTQKLRSDTQRLADRIERTDAAAARGPAFSDAVESAAKAAVAAAVLPPTSVEDVMIRPIPPKPSLFPEPAHEIEPQESPGKSFIPPRPERTAIRAPRMPRIDELPLPAQNQLRAQQGADSDAHHPEKRRMSLMQRLAAVGLGRKDEPGERPDAPPMMRQTPPGLDRLPQRPAPRTHDSRPQEPVSEYAKRTAPQGLDPHGRQAAVHNSPEDDQLDIPAFLRRQSN
ncbi:MAG: cell division protein FtsZ, partial [Xanthobacteraceae bacterium]